MYENDLELKLLRGKPIEIDGVGILHPLTLGEIEEIGEIQYNKQIFIATFKQDDIVIEGHTLTPFESVSVYLFQDESFREVFIDSMSKFFKEEVHYHRDSGFFYLGSLEEPRVVSEVKYNEIVDVIKRQNFIKSKQEEKEEFNPHDDKARELYEQLKKFRQKVKEQNQEKGLDLSDIIRIVSAYSGNINIFNVWNLTVYQLYALYISLMMKENYDAQYYLLPHVSDQKSLDLKHWARKLET